MTREEIIQAISDDQMMPFIQPEQLAQIVAFVINNYQLSLPSNLDEVTDDNEEAREYFQQGYEQAEKDLGWHPSTEHPPVDEEVIVLTDIITKGGLNAGFGKIAFGHIVNKDIAIDYDGWNIPGVRYWMPCPELPEK